MNAKSNKLTKALLVSGVFVANLLFVAAAFASEGAATGEAGAEGGVNAILPPMGELIPVAIAFLVLLVLMWKFALPGVVTSMDQRAATIQESLTKAEEARIEAERLLGEYKQQLAEARKEAQGILAEAKTAADNTRADAQAKAQAEAEALVEKARAAIEGEKRAAVAELQSSVAAISVAVAGKLIGSELSAEDHLKVVEKYIGEAGSLNAN